MVNKIGKGKIIGFILLTTLLVLLSSKASIAACGERELLYKDACVSDVYRSDNWQWCQEREAGDYLIEYIKEDEQCELGEALKNDLFLQQIKSDKVGLLESIIDDEDDYRKYKTLCCPENYCLPQHESCLPRPSSECEAGETPSTGAGDWKSGDKCKKVGRIYYCNTTNSSRDKAIYPSAYYWNTCEIFDYGFVEEWFSTCPEKATKKFSFLASVDPGIELTIKRADYEAMTNDTYQGLLGEEDNEIIATNTYPGSVMMKHHSPAWICADETYSIIGNATTERMTTLGYDFSTNKKPLRGWIANPFPRKEETIKVGEYLNVKTSGFNYEKSRESYLTVNCSEGVSKLPVPAIIPGCVPSTNWAGINWDSMTAGTFRFCEEDNCSGYKTSKAIRKYYETVNWIPNKCVSGKEVCHGSEGACITYDDPYNQCENNRYDLEARVNSTCFYGEKVKDGKYYAPHHTNVIKDEAGNLLGTCNATQKDNPNGRYTEIIRDCGNEGEGGGILVNKTRGAFVKGISCSSNGWAYKKYLEGEISSAYFMNSGGYSCGYNNCTGWRRNKNFMNCDEFRTNNKCPGFEKEGDKVSVVVKLRNNGTGKMENPFVLFANKEFDPLKDNTQEEVKYLVQPDSRPDPGKTGIYQIKFRKKNKNPEVEELKWVPNPEDEAPNVVKCDGEGEKCNKSVFNGKYFGFFFRNHGRGSRDEFLARSSNVKRVHESEEIDGVLEPGETMEVVLTMEASVWNKADMQVYLWDWESNFYEEIAAEDIEHDDPAGPRSYMSRINLPVNSRSEGSVALTSFNMSLYNLSFSNTSVETVFEKKNEKLRIADDKLKVTGNLNLQKNERDVNISCTDCIKVFASRMASDTFDVSWIKREQPTMEFEESPSFYRNPPLKKLNRWSGIVYIPRARNLRLSADLSMEKAGNDLGFEGSSVTKETLFFPETQDEESASSKMATFNKAWGENSNYEVSETELINNTVDLKFIDSARPLTFRTQKPSQKEHPSYFDVNISNTTELLRVRETDSDGLIELRAGGLEEDKYVVSVMNNEGEPAEGYSIELWNASPQGSETYEEEKHTVVSTPEVIQVDYPQRGLVPGSIFIKNPAGEELERITDYKIANSTTGEINITGQNGELLVTYSSFLPNKMLTRNITNSEGNATLNLECETSCKARYLRISVLPTVEYVEGMNVLLRTENGKTYTKTTGENGTVFFNEMIPDKGLLPEYRAFLLNKDEEVIGSIFGRNLRRFKCSDNCSTPSGKNKTPTKFDFWSKTGKKFNLTIYKGEVKENLEWKKIGWSNDSGEGKAQFKVNLWDKVETGAFLRFKIEILGRETPGPYEFTSRVVNTTPKNTDYAARKTLINNSWLIKNKAEGEWGNREKLEFRGKLDRRYLRVNVSKGAGDCESIRFFKEPAELVPSQTIDSGARNCIMLIDEPIDDGQRKTLWLHKGTNDLERTYKNWSQVNTEEGKISNNVFSVEMGACGKKNPCISNLSLKGSPTRLYGKGLGVLKHQLVDASYSLGKTGPIKSCMEINYKTKVPQKGTIRQGEEFVERTSLVPEEFRREICVYKGSTIVSDELSDFNVNQRVVNSGPGTWDLYFEQDEENLTAKSGGGQGIGEYAYFFDNSEDRSIGVFLSSKKKFNYSYQKAIRAISDPYVSDLYFSQNKEKLNIPDYEKLSNLSQSLNLYFSTLRNMIKPGNVYLDPYDFLGNAKYYSETWTTSGTSSNCKVDNKKGRDKLAGETCGYGNLKYSLGLVRPGIHLIEFFTVGEKYAGTGKVPRIDIINEDGRRGTEVTLPRESLIHYWPLDQLEKDKTKDIIGTTQGEIIGDPELVKGEGGGALKLNNTDGIKLPTSLPDKFTVITWIRITQNKTGNLIKTGNLVMGVDNSSTFMKIGGTKMMGPGLADGNWHRISATYDGETAKFYLDSIIANQTTLKDLEITGSEILIGGDKKHFNGSVDKIKLYDKPLSGSELKGEREVSAKLCDVKNGEIQGCMLERDDEGAPLRPKKRGYVISMIAFDENESVDYSAEEMEYYQAYVHPLRWDISYDLMIQPYLRKPIPINIVEGKNKLEISFCGDGSCQPRLGENNQTCSRDCS